MTPWIKMEPLSGPVGTQLIINGWGFRQGEDGITILWDKDMIATNIVAEDDGTLKIDGNSPMGSGSRLVRVPPSTRGKHVVVTYGSSFTPIGVLPDHIFEVIPQIKLEPNNGDRGIQVYMIGTGFSADETIKITYDEKTIDAPVKADTTGSFQASLVIPQSKGNQHTIKALGNKANTAQTIFTTSEKIPPVELHLLSPVNGTKVAIFNSVGDVFQYIWKYITGILDYFKGSGPAAYKSDMIVFKWSSISDSTNIKYNLQVASNSNFSSPLLNKDALTTPEYRHSQRDILPQGKYFWRARAIDSAGSEGEWSGVNQFEIIMAPSYVIIFSSIIGILSITAIVLGIIMVRVIRRR